VKKLVKDLELHEIDYIMAKAEGLDAIISDNVCRIRVNEDWKFEDYSPTTNPTQSWPIIEREGICLNIGMLSHEDNSVLFWNSTFDDSILQCGKTSLEAAMRCYVASKFGDEVDMDNLINK